jgi:hypothetical protein
LNFGCSDVIKKKAGIITETVYKTLVKDLKKKKLCACFVPHLLILNQQHSHTASSVEFTEVSDDHRNVMDDGSWCFIYNMETRHGMQLG